MRGLRIIIAEKKMRWDRILYQEDHGSSCRKLNVKPYLVSRGSRIIIAEKLNVRPDLVSRGSRVIIAEKLNVRPDLVSRGSRVIIADLRLTSCQWVIPKIIRTGSCTERIADHHCLRPCTERVICLWRNWFQRMLINHFMRIHVWMHEHLRCFDSCKNTWKF